MRIGIDIDEVITEFVDKYLEIYNKKYNDKISFEDITSYKFWESLPISKEEAIEIANFFYTSESFNNLNFIEGAKESIQNLLNIHKIFFITSRPLNIKDKTNSFLNTHFPKNSFELIFSGDFFEGNKTKAEICKDREVDILIEDNLDYALDCANKGVKVFLMNKPWNQYNFLHNGIIRVKNWQEILEKIAILK